LQNRLIQTSQTGGQVCWDTSPFSIPFSNVSKLKVTAISQNTSSPML
jgi:hypothetical protein